MEKDGAVISTWIERKFVFYYILQQAPPVDKPDVIYHAIIARSQSYWNKVADHEGVESLWQTMNIVTVLYNLKLENSVNATK